MPNLIKKSWTVSNMKAILYFSLFLSILMLLFFLFSSNLIKPIFFACHWLAMSNGCYNPFVYAIFSVRSNYITHREI